MLKLLELRLVAKLEMQLFVLLADMWELELESV